MRGVDPDTSNWIVPENSPAPAVLSL